MMGQGAKTALTGAGLVLVYTALMSLGDAITRVMAEGYAAPQLFCLSGALVMALSFGANRLRRTPQPLRTSFPRAMAMRCGLTVLASLGFYHAFGNLMFAEVFVFIGLIPLMAGLMSGPVLGERIRPASWVALGAGGLGILCLFPEGLGTMHFSHAIAFLACVCGTASMVLARYIGRSEPNDLAQVFFPNLAVFATMAVALPFVFEPMAWRDVGLAAVYALFLFGARWVLVAALRLLPAYAVTPLLNLQFVWMVLWGALMFGEWPGVHVFGGAAIVVASGLYLLLRQNAPAPRVQAAPWRVAPQGGGMLAGWLAAPSLFAGPLTLRRGIRGAR